MTVVDLYTLQLISDAPPNETYAHPLLAFEAALAEAEENLTDLLPAGYRARIRRWDHPDEPTQEDNDE